MEIGPTTLPGVFVCRDKRSADHRGTFARLYCERELGEIIGDRRIVQINHSSTSAVGAVRGLHYQLPPHAEMKLVRCLRGSVWDVVVDLRAGSPTLLRWYAAELSPDNGRMVIIPEGCAHGFQALKPQSELLYLHTAFYDPASEGGVSCTDPRLAIEWPLPIAELSERDGRHPAIEANFAGLQP